MLENDEDSEDGEDGSPSWWNKAVQDGVSQAAIDRVLGEDPEGETPEEFRGDMGERRGRGGTRRRKEGEQHVCGHRKGWSLLKEAEAAPIEN